MAATSLETMDKYDLLPNVFVTGEQLPITGRIKQRPEDFVVIEIDQNGSKVAKDTIRIFDARDLGIFQRGIQTTMFIILFTTSTTRETFEIGWGTRHDGSHLYHRNIRTKRSFFV